MFFFETRQNIFHLLIEKRFKMVLTSLGSRTNLNATNNKTSTLDNKILKALAPARDQSLVSSLVLSITMVKVECWFRKIRAFCSFKISQEMSITKDARAFRWGLLP